MIRALKSNETKKLNDHHLMQTNEEDEEEWHKTRSTTNCIKKTKTK